MLSAGSGNTVIKSKLISRRMFLLSIAKTAILVGVIGRLISLQINESTKYKTLSDKNRFREWKIAPERGIIKDYFNDMEISVLEQRTRYGEIINKMTENQQKTNDHVTHNHSLINHVLSIGITLG